ncbi:sulfite oxidase (plasmid) [Deinococcus aetherius]|uniref:Sulfite oxidase n=1 Tax=Deinococcus aetherius TaxID=200252 RepID=A0ABM8AI79_9DEIO|nr:sulfite oxidase [Deinococcus aetherius]BDP43521.1 sulfite oxidase [Deinococcus aetherius]
MPPSPPDLGPAPYLITREQSPPNLEFPFRNLNARVTPTASFYVRSHFPTPFLTAEDWSLTVGGAVTRPLRLGLAELRALPARTLTATMECAGNGRVFLTPRRRGVAWELGAVGTAEWTGVPLSKVLERAGLLGTACEVVLEGADRGTLTDPLPTPGDIPYARSVPLDKALGDVLLAYRMNGEALTPNHGFPVRAVVPGWYGMASVKWLTSVQVTAEPFQGYFQTVDYAYWETRDGLPPQLRPIGAMEVKATIARPAPHEEVPCDAVYEVAGAAWAGETDVARVEVSVDGGCTWREAEFLDPPTPHVWRRWRFAWHTPIRPGRRTLVARATDARDRTQPGAHDPARGGYMITHPLPVEVDVRERSP